MAKKTVASLHEGSKEGRAYTKVIKMVKSPKTGAYVFDEQMVRNEKVQDFFKNNRNSIYAINTKSSSLTNNEGIFYCFFFYFSILCYIFVALCIIQTTVNMGFFSFFFKGEEGNFR